MIRECKISKTNEADLESLYTALEQTLKEKLGSLVVSVFILPPSLQELEIRLNSRGQDSSEVIARRMERAKIEISKYDLYDYVLINKDFDFTTDPPINHPLDQELIKFLNPNRDPEYYNKKIINELMNKYFSDSGQIGGINNYKDKYMKYKTKYLELKKNLKK